ncbi:MAG: hypothetical protein V1898_01300 [Patescibacteria group bacterium]
MNKKSLINSLNSRILLILVTFLFVFLLNIKLTTASEIPSCQDDYSLFSRYPVAYSNINEIVPLGNLNPTGGHVLPTDHIYFYLKQGEGEYYGVPLTTNLYAPGRIWITSISSSTHLSADPVFTDYDIEFSPCSEVVGSFGHVSSLSNKLADAFNRAEGDCFTYWAGDSEYQRCNKQLSVKIKKGKKIGTAGGNQGQYALDLTLKDYRIKNLKFASPSYWYEGRNKIVCPVDYFGSAKKTLLQNKILRTKKPICGKYVQDMKKRAKGVWFNKKASGTNWDEDYQLALISDNNHPELSVISVGQALKNKGISAGAYTFSPQESEFIDRKFNEVRPNNKLYCYEASSQVFLIKMRSNKKLRIGPAKNSSCNAENWKFKDYKDFVR